jgi:hypothetical protein
MVGGDAIHINGLLGYATEKVASADDDADLAAQSVNGCDLFGYFVDEDGVDAEAAARGKGFSGELEEDSLVHVSFKYRMAEVWVFRLTLRSLATLVPAEASALKWPINLQLRFYKSPHRRMA